MSDTPTAFGSRRFEGRLCVVTASTQGIGLAIAERFAMEGGRVVVSSRKQTGVDEALVQIHKAPNVNPAHVVGVVCHVDKAEDRSALLKFATDHFGMSIDTLVLNAAVSTYAGPTIETPVKAYDKLFSTNLRSTFLFAQQALPFMKKGAHPTKPGAFTPSVLLVGSIGGYLPSAPIGIYGVTKTAMLGLMRALAPELAEEGIRINLLAPGIIRTNFAALLVDSIEKEKEPLLPLNTHLGRVGEPREMAGVAAFMCSADASYMTGESIVAAGGPARL